MTLRDFLIAQAKEIGYLVALLLGLLILRVILEAST